MKENIFIVTEFPQICSKEIKELVGKDSEIYRNICLVKNLEKSEIAKLCYRLQSSKRVCLYLNKSNEIPQKIEIDSKYLKEVKTFGVVSEGSEDKKFSSTEINTKLGSVIQEETKLDVDLSHPNITFYVWDEKEIFIGIDLVGFDMSKRPYKIAMQPDSLNGAFAYSLIRLAGYEKKYSLMDPFAGSGIIPIEAALFSSEISAFRFENKFNGFKLDFFKDSFLKEELIQKEKIPLGDNKIYAYDHMLKHVLGMQKNAKLAGIEKIMKMSKISLDWIDTKVGENEIDFIITDSPKFNKRLSNEKDLKKTFDELFYQAKFVLSKKGKLFILTNSQNILMEEAKKHSFKEKQNIEIIKGDQKLNFIEFQN